MRTAVAIIAGGLSLVIALQSCTGHVGGELPRDERWPVTGAGWLLALLFLIGAGFVRGIPLAASLAFGLAGFVGARAATGLTAPLLWEVAAWTLALVSLLGYREQRRARWQAIHRAIDTGLVPVATQDDERRSHHSLLTQPVTRRSGVSPSPNRGYRDGRTRPD